VRRKGKRVGVDLRVDPETRGGGVGVDLRVDPEGRRAGQGEEGRHIGLPQRVGSPQQAGSPLPGGGAALPPGWAWIKLNRVTDKVRKVNPQETLFEVFEYVDISSIDNSCNVITAPKFFQGKDAPSRARQELQKDDVVFSTVRPYLRNIGYIQDNKPNHLASTGFTVIRPGHLLLGKYAFYFTLSDEFIRIVCKLQRGVSYPAVRDNDVLDQFIPLPPLPEQERIVAKIEELFTQLDAATAALKRARGNLKRYRQAVLHAAVTGELTREWRAAHVAVGGEDVLGRILAERRMRWEAELRARGKDPATVKYVEPKAPDTRSLPALPEGWCWATVEQLMTKMQYGTSEKTHSEVNGIPVLRMGNIKDGSLDFTNLKYLSEKTRGIAELVLEDGDILFNRTNSAELVGKTALYKGNYPKATFASYIIRVKLVAQFKPEILAYFINSSLGREYIKLVVSQQVGQANVNGTKLSQMPIPLIPFGEQELIVLEVERYLSLAEQLEKVFSDSLQHINNLRQSILQRAFSGRLLDPLSEEEHA
jgi:type I restriction enzyme S subunit